REAKLMSLSISRRRFITGTVSASVAASAAGVVGFLAKRNGLIPPDHGGLLGIGETLTYAAHRVLLYRQPLAREFSRSEISKNFPAINTILPEDEAYLRDMTRGFQEWRLSVGGLVERPYDFSLAELKRFPSRTQITEHICEQGWSAIAEWTGVPLSYVLNAAGILPQAKFVFLNSIDGWWDSLDMA